MTTTHSKHLANKASTAKRTASSLRSLAEFNGLDAAGRGALLTAARIVDSMAAKTSKEAKAKKAAEDKFERAYKAALSEAIKLLNATYPSRNHGKGPRNHPRHDVLSAAGWRRFQGLPARRRSCHHHRRPSRRQPGYRPAAPGCRSLILEESMSVRPITDTLRHIGGGVFINTASDKLAELVAAVDSTGKAGSIDLKIKMKKATRGGAMHITGTVKLNKPAEEPMEAMLFATPEGNLVADDPHQQKLDLKSVAAASDTPVANLKTA